MTSFMGMTVLADHEGREFVVARSAPEAFRAFSGILQKKGVTEMAIHEKRCPSFLAVTLGCAAVAGALSFLAVKPASAGKPPPSPKPAPPGVLYYRAYFAGMPGADIYSMAADGSAKTLVLTNMGVETDASQHLHGSARWFLVFRPVEGETYPDGTTREELFAISTAEGQFQLTDDPSHEPNVGGWETRSPQWSVGDTRVSWAGRRWDPVSGVVSELGIFYVDLDQEISLGPTPAVPTRVPIADFPVEVDDLGYPKPLTTGFDWSPDGTSLVFGREDGLYVADAVTGLEAQITDTGWDSEPSWSPDGSSIAFRSDYGSPGGIWTVSPTGLNANLRLVLENGRRGAYMYFKPVWCPSPSYLSCEEMTWKVTGVTLQDVVRFQWDGSGLTNLTSTTDAWITLIGWTDSQ
jgi:hypothetical protein